MATVGFDLGSYAMKVIVAQPKGSQGLKIERALEAPNPVGTVFPDNPEKRQKLVDGIKQFFTENKIPTRNVRFAIPESVVASKIVSMPLLSDAELASAIQWQVEQHIPIPLEEMNYQYAVVRRSDKKAPVQNMDVLMIGVRSVIVQGLADLMLDAELDVADMETDTLANLRVLQYFTAPTDNVALLHIGATASAVTLVGQGYLQFVHAVPTGGSLFTRAIETGVGLDAMRAESYKRSYGLQAAQLEGRVRAALQPIIDSLVAETQKAIRFFGTQNSGQQIQRVFVSGGSLYLPDLLPYLSQALSLEVVPVELVQLKELEWKETVSQDSRFVVAAGLALKRI